MKYITTLFNELITGLRYISNVRNRNVIELTSQYVKQYDLKVSTVTCTIDDLNERFANKVIDLTCHLDQGTYHVIGIFTKVNTLGIHIKGVRIYDDGRLPHKVNHIKCLSNIDSVQCKVISQSILDDLLHSLKSDDNGKKINNRRI